MADNALRTYVPQAVFHPGITLLDYIEGYDWTQRELARRSALTPKIISEICSGKASISPITALALENVLQRPAHFWLNLQRLYDEAKVRESSAAVRETWADWAASFPTTEMKDLGMLPREGNLVENLLSFFGVASPNAWRSVFAADNISYRQSKHRTIDEFSVAAWVRATEIAAEKLSVDRFDQAALLDSLRELKAVTRAPIETFISSVQAICAKAGVAVVWVPALRSTGISGCARWLSNGKALVALTLRYKTDDQMWFTLLHEIGHLLLHTKKSRFILDNISLLDDESADHDVLKQEEEANRFAADMLIAPSNFSDFVKKHDFTSEAIYMFAEAVGVSPGIVVGRLQRERFLRPSQGNLLKRRLTLGQAELDHG